MRVNQFIAQATGLSRRRADDLILRGRILVNGNVPPLGLNITPNDEVKLDGNVINLNKTPLTIMLNKPRGYVVSRNGQGSKTIYSLIPTNLHYLKPLGRLDKDSSGLLLLSSDGLFINQLTHPKFSKEKVYKVTLNRTLTAEDKRKVTNGVILSDGLSQLQLSGKATRWDVTMTEGRNRQIRRTFEELGYFVFRLHRVSFGPYDLNGLATGHWKFIEKLS